MSEKRLEVLKRLANANEEFRTLVETAPTILELILDSYDWGMSDTETAERIELEAEVQGYPEGDSLTEISYKFVESAFNVLNAMGS